MNDCYLHHQAPDSSVQTLNIHFRGKGMPVTKAPGTFGNMIVKFTVDFPKFLTDDQKAQLRTVLG